MEEIKEKENIEQKEVQEEQTNSDEATESKSEKAESEETRETFIYVIKVTTNKEDRALEMISDKVKKKQLPVFSITRPHGLRGYIFLEAPEREVAEEAAYNLPYVKGIIGKTITYEEIKNMLTPDIETINISEGDIIEIIGEPFKKEKAKVTRVDKQKAEVVVSLLGAVVPIPVTVKIDNVKVIRKGDEETDEDGITVVKEEGSEESQEEKPQEDQHMMDDEDDFEGPKIGGL